VKESLGELERKALLNRPELRTVDYQKRINAKETKVAILELLPSLNVYFGENYDSNGFLFHNNWLSYGAKISWNLMNVFRHPARLQVIDAQKEVLNMQSLALTMTIMTQVHVAVAQYEAALEDVKLTQRYFETQMKIADHVHQSWALNRLSEHKVIREKVQGLLAELRYEMALAKLEMAYANLLAAIGEDPFPVNLSDEEVEKLAQDLQQRWEWLGQHATVLKLEPEQKSKQEQEGGGVQP
jgi:outer membrane protein TolC